MPIVGVAVIVSVGVIVVPRTIPRIVVPIPRIVVRIPTPIVVAVVGTIPIVVVPAPAVIDINIGSGGFGGCIVGRYVHAIAIERHKVRAIFHVVDGRVVTIDMHKQIFAARATDTVRIGVVLFRQTDFVVGGSLALQ